MNTTNPSEPTARRHRPWIGRNQFDSVDDLVRFSEKTRRAESGCLEWIGAINSSGYGSVWIAGRSINAARAAYFVAYGEIPAGLHVLHHCDNRKCVEPTHLYVGTNKQNNEDKVRRDRARGAVGERNCKAKLTPAIVATIRASKRGESELARQYSVHRSTIRRIRIRQGWRHL